MSFFGNNKISISINVDGLPLAGSSGSQVYPILCSLADFQDVDMVGIYHGYQKPKDANCFLHDFAKEAVDLVNNEISINGQLYYVQVKSFIYDVSAKAYIKYTKGHAGYSSCTKCYIQGESRNGTTCFPDIDNICLQTDSDFRRKKVEAHHNGTSILETIPGINMIDSFPLDYMHLICLGVVKKLVYNLWCCGKPWTKVTPREHSRVSQSLKNLARCIPVEFNRKPRSLDDASRWKATEYRQFLFYTGPVALLKNIDI
ncbi:uncharacterized protein LOC143369670 [Andrena cerasifolii]|uniref:uncharacterized protein LOC143369670 n=1 Tax=Andrena cerasifolii TaxID=2819439 RepID=UPI0040380C7B